MLTHKGEYTYTKSYNGSNRGLSPNAFDWKMVETNLFDKQSHEIKLFKDIFGFKIFWNETKM